MSHVEDRISIIPPVVQGTALWFVAGIFIQYNPSLFSGFSPINFLAAVPVCYITARALTAINGWNTRAKVIEGMSIATGAALLLDGLAHGLKPSFYGATQTHIINGASWILWGAGWGLILSFITPPANKKNL